METIKNTNLGMTKTDLEEYLKTTLSGKPYDYYNAGWEVYQIIKSLLPKSIADKLSYTTDKNQKNCITIIYDNRVSFLFIEIHRKLIKRVKSYYGYKSGADYSYGYFEVYWLDGINLAQRLDEVVALRDKFLDAEALKKARAKKLYEYALAEFGIDNHQAHELFIYINKYFYSFTE